MEVSVVKKAKLTEMFGSIFSVVVVKSARGTGKSLAVSTYDYGTRFINLPRYDNFDVGVYYIPLDKFTYGAPSNVAIPEYLWDFITVSVKEVTNPEQGRGFKFVRASITKKIF